MRYILRSFRSIFRVSTEYGMAAKPCLYLTYSYFVLFPLPPHLSFPLFFANVGRLHYTLVLLKGKTNAALREQAHTPLKYLLCGIFVANTTTTTTKHYYCDLFIETTCTTQRPRYARSSRCTGTWSCGRAAHRLQYAHRPVFNRGVERAALRAQAVGLTLVTLTLTLALALALTVSRPPEP